MKPGDTVKGAVACLAAVLCMALLSCDSGSRVAGPDSESVPFERGVTAEDLLEHLNDWENYECSELLITSEEEWWTLTRLPREASNVPVDFDLVDLILLKRLCSTGCREGSALMVDRVEVVESTLHVQARWLYGCDRDCSALTLDWDAVTIPKLGLPATFDVRRIVGC